MERPQLSLAPDTEPSDPTTPEKKDSKISPKARIDTFLRDGALGELQTRNYSSRRGAAQPWIPAEEAKMASESFLAYRHGLENGGNNDRFARGSALSYLQNSFDWPSPGFILITVQQAPLYIGQCSQGKLTLKLAVFSGSFFKFIPCVICCTN